MTDGTTARLDGLFTEVRPVRSFEDIALQIQLAVTRGQLKDGDRLPNERELGAVFGVSRATLREALRVLEGAGVVEVRRGAAGGIFVAEPGAGQVGRALDALIRFRGATAVELAEFRGSFEGETAFWAAKRATAEHIARLQNITGRYSGQVTEARWTELVELDVSFHEAVAYASCNQVRVAIMLGIHGALRHVSLALENLANTAFRQHEAEQLAGIADAIARRQPQRARRLMRQHVLWNSEVEVTMAEESADEATGPRDNTRPGQPE